MNHSNHSKTLTTHWPSNNNADFNEQSIHSQQQNDYRFSSSSSSLSSFIKPTTTATTATSPPSIHLQSNSLFQSPSSSSSLPLPISHSSPSPSSSLSSASIHNHHQQQHTIDRRRSSDQASKIDSDIDDVIRHCHYLSNTMAQQKYLLLDQDYFSDSKKMGPWLDGMVGKANEVLNGLLRLRKYQMAAEIAKLNGHQDYHQDPNNHDLNKSGNSEGSFHTIRHKKRGRRSVFQGRCHSCNISETPEWRRGPDGARTLCNACGLHYAKLARKQVEQEQKDNLSKRNDSLNKTTATTSPASTSTSLDSTTSS
ncbi:hypothetical protein BJ944DRAFT_41371 [Cunninghamella echinulata]|nr:hypothetical protein BJ944DRAFT_41371 [Cunninghamella echinulata]